MNKILAKSIFCIATFILIACTKVPLTERSQLSLIPENDLILMADSSYKTFLKENKVIQTGNDAEKVKKIGEEIKVAVELYFKENNIQDQLEGFAWEFNLVENDAINAWCMPGGKVVFYTGILPICEDDDGIAVIMGHEIAHAVAKHANERMSQAMGIGAIGLIASLIIGAESPENLQMFNQLFGIGANVGLLLPNSRNQESEADRLGLIFMSMAGYNPEKAVGFWQRMSALGKESPPEFLSTHPNDQTRIENIRKWLPEAMGFAIK